MQRKVKLTPHASFKTLQMQIEELNNIFDNTQAKLVVRAVSLTALAENERNK